VTNTTERRCDWGSAWSDPLYLAYHDREWGVPIRDERTMFEFLILEGAQAGLSWSTILHRREGYRTAFAAFDAEQVARFGPEDVARLMDDPGIVRNRAKVASAIKNARATLELRESGTSLADHLWSFVGAAPRVNRWQATADMPVVTAESTAMSRDLKRRGFAFVGPTVCYSIMQATGMVNDHLVDCFRWSEVQRGVVTRSSPQ
jgi:DNA-3-methyladenine glycosylase I